MTSYMLEFIRNFVWSKGAVGPVLEIGSFVETHQEHLNLRRAFPPGTPYLGVDLLDGPGVDRKANLLDEGQMKTLLDSYAPKTTLCLYVLEHAWEIHKAAKALANIWLRNPESWLLVSTHQSQPYHGTGEYGDYWRITATGMRQLMEEAGATSAVFVYPDSSSPSDVLAIRQPASMPWPADAFAAVLRNTETFGFHWEHYC